MDIEFDLAKDALNIEKHGISLARAADMDLRAYVPDDRCGEPRFRLYGFIDGIAHCVAGTERNGVVRVINVRRAHRKEMHLYVR